MSFLGSQSGGLFVFGTFAKNYVMFGVQLDSSDMLSDRGAAITTVKGWQPGGSEKVWVCGGTRESSLAERAPE